ncbi:DMT family transporter [Roseivivax isoporae]|uniref:Membrane protein n=1 Tax=Roseivivax isoporae LMG 25204 TaxID=1449351 RepID=X7F6M2_9RHOB|nr:DMT family transporter [Roseivivax isoporae]ETX28450.1 membrane protein [Roseivivax isoporae LMG 25204]
MQPHQDRPLLGILLMLGFCVTAPLGDAVAKLLGGVLPVLQLVFLRFALQAVLLAPVVAATGRDWRMTRRLAGLTLLRTLLHIGGIAMMFAALVHLPLADAIAIAFVMPFLLLLLGRFVLDEEVGARRLGACAVGFAGTLMVVQPAFEEVGPPALLPLGVAVTFALFMLVTRKIARDTDPVALQAVSGVMAVVLLAPALLFLPGPVFAWVAPAGGDWALILTLGALGTAGHLLMTWSLRFAPGATLAPMQYLEIPVATLIGFAIFGDLPDPLAAAGIAVTVASGLYIVLRERALSRAATRVAPPAA